MPVTVNQLKLRYSESTGPAGLSNAGTAVAAYGGFVSTTEAVSGALGNIFRPLTGTENAALEAQYRCLFICNDSGVDTWTGVTLYLSAVVAGGADDAIGLDPAGVVAQSLGSAQAAIIASDTTAPAGVSFSAPTVIGSALSIGDIGPGQCQAIWLRRTGTNSPALANDGVTLRFDGGE